MTNKKIKFITYLNNGYIIKKTIHVIKQEKESFSVDIITNNPLMEIEEKIDLKISSPSYEDKNKEKIDLMTNEIEELISIISKNKVRTKSKED